MKWWFLLKKKTCKVIAKINDTQSIIFNPNKKTKNISWSRTVLSYENIIILGREQEIDEVEILSALIESEGVNKNKIIKINDNKNTYNNILTMDRLLSEKEIQGINLITSPYHTYRSKMIWQKNSNIKLNIIQNLDNPLNYKYAEKKLSYTKIKVIFYEFISLIYNKFLGNSN